MPYLVKCDPKVPRSVRPEVEEWCFRLKIKGTAIPAFTLNFSIVSTYCINCFQIAFTVNEHDDDNYLDQNDCRVIDVVGQRPINYSIDQTASNALCLS